MEASLVLEDGSVYRGSSFGARTEAIGEVVFSTGMVGYVESLTDPSYHGQILVLTWPLAGSYGVPQFNPGCAAFESDRIQTSGVIVTRHIFEYSHHSAGIALGEWLLSQGVPGVEHVDTRAVTKALRSRGTMPGAILMGTGKGVPGKTSREDWNPVDRVSPTETVLLNSTGSPRVTILDCGCKRSIVTALLERGCSVRLLPFEHDLNNVEKGLLLVSNGPGDPAVLKTTIRNLASAFEGSTDLPVAGICLGCQLMALAAGGRTWKLPYGHRSQNQPVEIIAGKNRRCIITSQNHGYAVDSQSLPVGWEVWMTNLNDGTVEGIRHLRQPRFAVQFHPEGSPGPLDSVSFFDNLLEEALNA